MARYFRNSRSNKNRNTNSYKTPEGMKRIWTVNGKNGVGRLLADSQGQTHIHMVLNCNTEGQAFKKPAAFKCPTARLDVAAMELPQREDGSPNFLAAIQKAVNGEGKLIFLPKSQAETAPVEAAPAETAPVEAAPVEAAPTEATPVAE